MASAAIIRDFTRYCVVRASFLQYFAPSASRLAGPRKRPFPRCMALRGGHRYSPFRRCCRRFATNRWGLSVPRCVSRWRYSLGCCRLFPTTNPNRRVVPLKRFVRAVGRFLRIRASRRSLEAREFEFYLGPWSTYLHYLTALGLGTTYPNKSTWCSRNFPTTIEAKRTMTFS